ncbi:type II toxin-antitoxin system death-on-curing family toxin [Mucilaginibacter xinganensis]|nr:type II toxin-antitoxin system death-on-curing family toxin [Mucilaginibacter xinganensis]
MIHIDIANYLHNLLIDEFGGSKGIRDNGSLEAALNRPFATFDGQDLYPTVVEKATAIFESIIINHPFMDGNKRTAYVLLEYLLLNKGGIKLDASFEEKYQMVIEASTGEIRFDEIKTWISSKIKV